MACYLLQHNAGLQVLDKYCEASPPQRSAVRWHLSYHCVFLIFVSEACARMPAGWKTVGRGGRRGNVKEIDESMDTPNAGRVSAPTTYRCGTHSEPCGHGSVVSGVVVCARRTGICSV
jgi:hypothetical protein